MESPRRRLLALAVALPLLVVELGLLSLPVLAASAPSDQPARGLHYAGLQRAAAASPCAGGYEIGSMAGRNGPVRCSHGPDAAPANIDVRVARQPESAAQAALPPDTTAATAGTLCTGDGVTGPRVQLVYATIAGQPDRYVAYASSLAIWAAAMDNVFSQSAAETGGDRRLRFVHDAGCTPTVARVTLSAAAGNDFNATVNELSAAGYNRDDRKYLVWADTNVYCGIGEVYSDDRAGQNNYNNVYGMVARVDNGCWGLSGQSVEAHELMHTLGGVQKTAPHGTTFNHCTDDYDRMCYTDGSGSTTTVVCPAATHENLFDCNHDDYFSTAPPTGSYLATHWNTASSAWLTTPAAGPVATVPGAATGVAAVPGEGLATVTWAAPASDGGAAITGYVVTPYVGATAGAAQTVAAAVTSQTVTGLTNGTSYTFKVAAQNSVGTGAASAASAAVVPDVGSRFHPLPPARLLDTRSGVGAPVAKVASGGVLNLQVAGRGGVPATGASAVVLNITVTEPVSGGFITAWPTGEALPVASNLNFGPGQTVPNLVEVKLGAGGQVSLYDGGGATHLVADVAGWYGPTGETAGSRYHPLSPVRLLDTRSGLGGLLAKVLPSSALDLQVTGRGGVPTTGVSAVVLNVTVTGPLAGGFLTAWPTGDLLPLASNLNFSAGQTVPNLVIVKLGAGGQVSLFNAGGAADMVADVAGWFGADGEATGARYHPVSPARLLDTRAAIGAPQAAVVAGGSLALQVTGRGGVPASGVTAVVLNVTVVDPQAGGYLTVWPTGDLLPLASNLNFGPGQTVPNLVVAKLGAGGKVSLYNGGGSANLVADVAGWYGAAS